MPKNKKGFTLIELLIVIGILSILIGAVVVAVNPIRQFAQARNSQRWTHVHSILNAVYQNIVDNQGIFVCPAGSLPNIATYMRVNDGYDICNCLVPTYLAEFPFDLSAEEASYTSCQSYDSKYQIFQDNVTKRITISAPFAELDEVIDVIR